MKIFFISVDALISENDSGKKLYMIPSIGQRFSNNFGDGTLLEHKNF